MGGGRLYRVLDGVMRCRPRSGGAALVACRPRAFLQRQLRRTMKPTAVIVPAVDSDNPVVSFLKLNLLV